MPVPNAVRSSVMKLPAPISKKYLLVHLRGVTPLLMHPITDHTRREQIIKISKQPLADLLVRDTRSGCIAVPGRWLKHAVRMAAWPYQDRHSGHFVDQVSQYCIIGGYLILSSTSGWSVYSRNRHARPNSREMGIVRCPQFDDWSCEALISFSAPLNEKIIQRLVGSAGRDIGIGLFSAEQRGAYGKFEAVSWQWTEQPKGYAGE